MTFLKDWKFLLAQLVAVAAIGVPVWIWQSDLNSKSVSVHVLSKVSLQPKEDASLPGVEISMEGMPLQNPHVVSFQISNDGSRPIPSSDFESPLMIAIDSKSSFVRSRVTSSFPKDLNAEIVTKSDSIALKPLLLNPKDNLAISVLTTGETPVFSIRSRIIGVSSVQLLDQSTEKPSTGSPWLSLGFAVLFFVASMLAYGGPFSSSVVVLRKRASMFIALVAAFPGVHYLLKALEATGNNGFGAYIAATAFLLVPVTLIARTINRFSATQSESSEGKSYTGGAI